MIEARLELERAVHAALETYSNVHRGSGHDSLVTTLLYERARAIVLEHLELDGRDHVLVFAAPRRAEQLAAQLPPGSFRVASSRDLGLPLGVRALAVARRAVPRGRPWPAGGGTARLVSPGWVVWADAPARLEAGTPAIVNVVAFAKALCLLARHGDGAFADGASDSLAAEDVLGANPWPGLSGRALLEALRSTLVGRGHTAPTVAGPRPYVNLDNAASTPTFEPVWDAVRRAWRVPEPLRPELAARVRALCAEVLNAPPGDYDVLFTSNTTEAVNLVAEGLKGRRGDRRAVVVNTVLEHNSNELPWRLSHGVSTIRLAVDREGFLGLDELEAALSAPAAYGGPEGTPVELVAVSGASNVLGTFNDLAGIGQVARRHGALFLVDAAQLVAHRAVDVAASGIDFLAFSAHKAYAPFGCGILIARKGLLAFDDEERERIRSSGEENIGGLAGLGMSLELLRRIGFDVIREEEQALTRYALRGLTSVPGLAVHGIADPDSPRLDRRGGVLAFELKGRFANRLAEALRDRGIGVRYGCHCAHLLVKRILRVPRLLEQFQWLIVNLFPRLELPGVARASLGLASGESDVDALVDALREIAAGKRSGGGAARGPLDEAAHAAVERVYTDRSYGP
jgi:selenocysteine lyase/cysteine desulfurase